VKKAIDTSGAVGIGQFDGGLNAVTRAISAAVGKKKENRMENATCPRCGEAMEAKDGKLVCAGCKISMELVKTEKAAATEPAAGADKADDAVDNEGPEGTAGDSEQEGEQGEDADKEGTDE